MFGVFFPSQRGGVFGTFVKDIIIEGKDKYDAIGLSMFDYKTFEEEEGGGI